MDNLLKVSFVGVVSIRQTCAELVDAWRKPPSEIVIKIQEGGCDALSVVEARFLALSCVEVSKSPK